MLVCDTLVSIVSVSYIETPLKDVPIASYQKLLTTPKCFPALLSTSEFTKKD